MTPKLQQTIIAVVLFFGMVLFAMYNYMLVPLDKKQKEADIKYTALERKLIETKRRAQELPKLQAEMQYLQREVAELEKLLPQEKEVPGLLRIISRKAQGYQLQVGSIKPLAIIPKEHYNEVPFQISLKGRYHTLARFFADIGQTTRLLSVRNVTYSTYSGTKEDPQTLSADFTFVAYTFRQ